MLSVPEIDDGVFNQIALLICDRFKAKASKSPGLYLSYHYCLLRVQFSAKDLVTDDGKVSRHTVNIWESLTLDTTVAANTAYRLRTDEFTA